jgi:hypothetical protein
MVQHFHASVFDRRPHCCTALKRNAARGELSGGAWGKAKRLRSVVREVQEGLGAVVQVGPILAAWGQEVPPGRRVFIVAYVAFRTRRNAPVVSTEHKRLPAWPAEAWPNSSLPEGYPRATTVYLFMTNTAL